jgi:transposase
MIRTYSVRLRPTKQQSSDLHRILGVCCELYNAALQERRDAWKVCRKRITYYDQTRELTQLRKVDAETALVPVHIARDPLRRVARAFDDFFRRCKTGRNPGYPRFRAKHRYDSFGTYRCRIEGETIRMPGMRIRFKNHRELRGTSQRCFNCGRVKKKELSERWHSCECGANLHRDHNAALNVLSLGQRLVDLLAEAR